MYNEKIEQKIEEWSYIELLKNIKEATHGIKSRLLGYQIIEGLDAEFPIYSFEINPGRKRKIFILSGVHGEEIAGPISLFYVLRASHHYFDHNTSYVVVPVLNPYAYDLKQRFDDDNADLNCIYKSVLDNKHYEEKRAVLKFYKKEKFDLFISLHEDMDMKDFYIYGYGDENLGVYKSVLEIAKSHDLKLLNWDEVYGVPLDEKGLVMNFYDKSIDNYFYSEEIAKVAFTTETPMKLPLQKRVEVTKDIVKSLHKFLPQ